MATQSNTIVATPSDFLQSGLGTPAMRLNRGRPFRAQGTLGHYVVFAEMLMQLGCIAWALLLVSIRDRRWTLVFGLAFVGITAALFMTGTRAAVAGLVVGCMLSLLLLSKGWLRWVLIGMLVGNCGGVPLSGYNIQEACTGWTAKTIGTHFRLLMWEDGIRLVREHPWFGVGMETVRLHWQEWNIRGFIQYTCKAISTRTIFRSPSSGEFLHC